MRNHFTKDYIGPPFDWFGPIHLILLGITLVLSLLILLWKPARRGQVLFRYSVAALLVVNSIAWHWWKASIGEWTLQEMLPLHLSGILVWLVPVMLIIRSRSLFVFAFFCGNSGNSAGSSFSSTRYL